MEVQAGAQLEKAQRAQELRVFLYRLALTFAAVGGGWVVAASTAAAAALCVGLCALFAVFAFFVELVPYLPSYGGYVRSIKRIVVTALVGRWAILALQRYLERQRQAEVPLAAAAHPARL